MAALGADGKFASYSDWGANVFVTAPSSADGTYGITTTDRSGDAGYNTSTHTDDTFPNTNYTSTFGGTSAATPVVAGVMALGKQVNPAMDVRMAKHILARTSTVVDPSDSSDMGGWTTNAAGYHFNENYGFGLINADSFTQLAAQVKSVTPQTHESTGLGYVGSTIPNGPSPDGYNYGTTAWFYLNGTDPLEDIQVHLNITHPWRGELAARLVSLESYTSSWIMYPNLVDSFEDVDWTFETNAFWGEQPQGFWAIQVFDLTDVLGETHTGTWNWFLGRYQHGQLDHGPRAGSPGPASRIHADGRRRARSPTQANDAPSLEETRDSRKRQLTPLSSPLSSAAACIGTSSASRCPRWMSS